MGKNEKLTSTLDAEVKKNRAIIEVEADELVACTLALSAERIQENLRKIIQARERAGVPSLPAFFAGHTLAARKLREMAAEICPTNRNKGRLSVSLE